jgi:hypothetical protein
MRPKTSDFGAASQVLKENAEKALIWEENTCVAEIVRLSLGRKPLWGKERIEIGLCQEGVRGMKRSTKLQVFGVALAGAVAMTAQAQPFNTLKFDINTVTSTIAGGTGAGGSLAPGGGDVGTFGGTITWTTGAAAFAGLVHGNNVGILGSFAAVAGSAGTLSSVSGSLAFAGGVTTGVALTFSNTVGDSFTTSIAAGGSLLFDGLFYTVSGLTFAGTFPALPGDSLFGTVDISSFAAAGNLFDGFFKDILINPGMVVDETDLELIITVPLPGGAAMASLGLLGLVSRRRRA